MSSPTNPLRARMRTDPPSAFAIDVVRGLSDTPKHLPSKYFYDAEGSRLFEAICAQPEYYLTRVELALMRSHAGEIAASLGPGVRLVEYGSGAGIKTRLLLRRMLQPAGYVPVEISVSALSASVKTMREALPGLEVRPVRADFTAVHALPDLPVTSTRTVIYFPGSTLGNFDSAESIALLRQMHDEMGASGAALIGIDLHKDSEIIEAAYNDAAGVTSAFTLNLLTHINRELDGNFDLTRFAHRASYNIPARRIETRIVSRCEQDVHAAGHTFHFVENEAIHVEISSKYELESFATLAASAGLRVNRHWTDDAGWFALVLLEPEH